MSKELKERVLCDIDGYVLSGFWRHATFEYTVFTRGKFKECTHYYVCKKKDLIPFLETLILLETKGENYLKNEFRKNVDKLLISR